MADTYAKLPGHALSPDGFSRLWVGPDHLLQVKSWVVAERYGRFYFRDIRGFIIQPSRRFALWNWIFGVIVGLSALGVTLALAGAALLTGGELQVFFRGLLFSVAGMAGMALLFFLPLLVIHLMKGATCDCYLDTVTGRVRLGAPSRRKHARRLLSAVSPLILEYQQSVPSQNA